MYDAVDIVVNIFERTYRDVLTPGYFSKIEEMSRFKFANKIVLINNVNDLEDCLRRLSPLLANNEITSYYLVEDYIDMALSKIGLERRDLGRIPHYSDCALVAPLVARSDWLLYWDAEVWLREPIDWVSPSIALMKELPNVFVANPIPWKIAPERVVRLERESIFQLAYGFSDAVFLVRRESLLKPVYSVFTPASLRYPLSHVAPVFEQRIDSYMRKNRLLRATFLQAKYEHPSNEGAGYPGITFEEKLRSIRNRIIMKALWNMPFRSPLLRP